MTLQLTAGVWSNSRPRNLQESKELIQARVKHGDNKGVEREWNWLVKIHGPMIDKIVDSWIREVRFVKSV